MEAPRRVALITGASSGLGAEMARQLAADGWAVALLARRRERLDEVAAAITAGGGRALVEVVDVVDRAAVAAAVQRAEHELGPLQLVIANAGIGVSAPLLEEEGDAFERMLAVNVTGAWNVARASVPGMVARGRGRLVGISSQAAFTGLPGSGGYAASKAALTRWLESVRIELVGTGVGVTIVHPGFVESEMTATNRHPMPFLLSTEAGVRRLLRAVHRGRRQVTFPRRLRWAIGVVRRLPPGLQARLLRKARAPRDT